MTAGSALLRTERVYVVRIFTDLEGTAPNVGGGDAEPQQPVSWLVLCVDLPVMHQIRIAFPCDQVRK